MESAQHKYLSMGDFVQASRLSRKALRLYDERNILPPAYVDPESGYRYYQSDQLVVARLIRLLRQMEMPLITIRKVINAAPEQQEALILAHERVYSARVAQVQRAIHSVLSTLHNKEQAMSFTVENITLEPQMVVTVTRRTLVESLDQCIRTSLEQIKQFVQTNNGKLTGAPLGIYHGAINEEEDGPIEICWPVKSALAPSGDVALRELAGGPAALVNLHGEACKVPNILSAYDAAYDWIQMHDHQTAAAPREVWFSAPGEDAHMQIIWPYK
jgi:DNA-binding transcriptional MerR regulator